MASGLGLIGWEWFPSTADFGVAVRTDASETVVVCDGFVGRGYWVHDVTALSALTSVLIDQPATRAALFDPGAVLRATATIAGWRGVDDSGRRTHLAELLTIGRSEKRSDDKPFP